MKKKSKIGSVRFDALLEKKRKNGIVRSILKNVTTDFLEPATYQTYFNPNTNEIRVAGEPTPNVVVIGKMFEGDVNHSIKIAVGITLNELEKYGNTSPHNFDNTERIDIILGYVHEFLSVYSSLMKDYEETTQFESTSDDDAGPALGIRSLDKALALKTKTNHYSIKLGKGASSFLDNVEDRLFNEK